jgi:hypothetical protein
MRTFLILGSIAACLLAQAPSPATEAKPIPKSFRFESTVDVALKAARDSARRVLWVIMKDGEVGCSRMLETVYADPEVREKLSAGFVLIPCSTYHHTPETPDSKDAPAECPQFSGVACRDHQACEREMRKRFEESVTVVAPQHIITDADGKVLARHRYELKKGPFLEFLANGSGVTETPAGGGLRRPDRKETKPSASAEKLLGLVRSAPDEERLKAAKELCTTGDKVCVAAFVADLEKGSGITDKLRAALIRAPGAAECAPAVEEFQKLLQLKDPLLRNAAVVTLEEMEDSRAAPPLLALWKTEKDPEIKKDILRALGPSGAGNDEARALLLKECKNSSELLRVGAVVALGSHTAGHADVRKALAERWKSGNGKNTQQLAVIFAWWMSKNPECLEDVEAARAVETNGEKKDLLDLVIRSLGGTVEAGPPRGGGRFGPFRVLQSLSTLFVKDRVQRHRMKELMERPAGLRGF